MATIQIVFASGYGQTRKIAERIAARASERGFRVKLTDAKLSPEVRVDADAAVIGASIYAGRHIKPIPAVVGLNKERLRSMPSAFFSVSGSAGREADKGEAKKYVDEFVKATGWKPDLTATFGGALNYTQYGFFLRLIIKWMARSHGDPTDTSRDWELTDWKAVDEFATRFFDRIPAAARKPAAEQPSALL